MAGPGATDASIIPVRAANLAADDEHGLVRVHPTASDRVSKALQRHVAHHAAPVAPLKVLALALCRCPSQRSETVPQVSLLIRMGVRDLSEALAALARVALLSISPGEIKLARMRC